MIDLNCIHSFIRLGETGSFSRAASTLGITKARMSRHIARLEQELDQTLVYRTTRQVRLTNAGRELYDSLRESFDHVDGVLMRARQTERLSGTLRITAPEDLGAALLTELVCEYCDKHPDVRFELLYSERRLDLMQDRIDVAIRAGNLKGDPVTPKARGLSPLPQILVATPIYLSRHFTPQRVQQLAELDLLLHDPQAETKNKSLCFKHKDGQVQQLEVRARFSSSSMNSLKQLALHHRGVALVPAFLARQELKAGLLARVLPHWQPPASPMWAVSPGKKEKDPLVTSFKAFLAEKSKEAFWCFDGS